MKNPVNLLFLIFTVLMCTVRCNNIQSTHKEYSLDKAVIYYNPNDTPWGLLKVVDVPMHQFLKYKANCSKITLTNRDSLQYISSSIKKSQRLGLANYNQIDTSIAVLLFSDNNVDTLATDAFPSHPIQYNDLLIQDSTLVYYIIDIICAQNSNWHSSAKYFYYNGTYNPMPILIR